MKHNKIDRFLIDIAKKNNTKKGLKTTMDLGL